MQASRPASTSTRPGGSPMPPRAPLQQVNTQTRVLNTTHGRIICVADIRGRISQLNDLARENNAIAVIHTGDFGFFEASSLGRISDRTLRHLTMYSPLVPVAQRTHLLAPENSSANIRETVTVELLSEFPLLLSGQIKLQVPVYTVWGACEDVAVLEKIRSGTYKVDNLEVIDEATTRLLDIGGIKLRLFGLGGAVVPHKMFDNGEGAATIAGGQGTMWTTALQIGELVDTAQRVYDPSETRLLVAHTSPGREGIIAQLALVLKADLTISAGLHFRYTTSYNEFSVQGDYAGFLHKLKVGKEAFDRVWETVKNQVDQVIDENQRILLEKALSVIERIPPPLPAVGQGTEEPAWKNCWNWNLCDAAFGSLTLDIRDGRVSAENKSQGFNYAYRRSATPAQHSAVTPSANAPAAATSGPPTKPTTPAPAAAPKLLSGTQSPAHTPKTNGASPLPSSDKAEREKAKKKEKKEQRKERDRAEKDAAEGGTGTGSTGSPAPTAALPVEPSTSAAEGTPEDDSHSGLKSPTTDSTGINTPTRGQQKRNPWTIYMRMSVAASEEQVREFYGEAKDGITRVNYPNSFPGRAQKLAYVEFGDEEAMRAGLDKHAEKLNDSIPEVKQATPPEERGGGFRGGPRGRGRGGFAARGFAAVGLTKAGNRPNDDAPSPGPQNS